MKKTFVTPQFELISMDTADVLTTSGNGFLDAKSEGGAARVIDCSEYLA